MSLQQNLFIQTELWEIWYQSVWQETATWQTPTPFRICLPWNQIFTRFKVKWCQMIQNESDLGHNTVIEIFELYLCGCNKVIQYLHDWYNYPRLKMIWYTVYQNDFKYLMLPKRVQQRLQSPIRIEMEYSHVVDVELLHPLRGKIFENQQYQYRYFLLLWQIF